MRTTEFQTLNSSSEAIPTFLLKAYEILEVDLAGYRMINFLIS